MGNIFLRRAKTSIRRVATTIACGLLILSGSHARAQGPPVAPAAGGVKWQAGLDVLGAIALGDFATNVEGAGGVAVYLDKAVRESMFSLGGEFGYMTYGETSRTVPLGTLIPEVRMPR